MQSKEQYTALFGTAGPVGVDLLMAMLSLDPRGRPTARRVLEHSWWAADPRPTRKEDLPRKGAGGEARLAEDLKRRAGEVDEGRGVKVARKLDFGGR